MMFCGTGGVDGMKAELLSTALKWSKICARSVTLSAAPPSTPAVRVADTADQQHLFLSCQPAVHEKLCCF